MCTEQNSPDTHIPPNKAPGASFIACVPVSVNGAAQEENPGNIPDTSFLFPFLLRKTWNVVHTYTQVIYICLER